MQKLKILTFNIFDSPLSTNRRTRINRLASELSKIKPEIICLQEAIFPDTYKLLRNGLKKLGYKLYPKSLIPLYNGGLLTATTLKVSYHTFKRFHDHGPFLSLSISDRMIHKGFQKIKLKLGRKDVYLINTHLEGRYHVRNLKNFIPIRKQIDYIIHHTKKLGKPTIICGDFNIPPKHPLHKMLVETLSLTDPLEKSNAVTDKSNNPNKLFFFPKQNFRPDNTLLSKNWAKRVTQKVIFSKSFTRNKKKMFLSDHFGLLTTCYI